MQRAQLATKSGAFSAHAGVVCVFLCRGAPAELELKLLAVHFHDTYGQALSNSLTALMEGVTTIDSSIGGLGGCPFAQSATGNLATEDLVWQLHGMGISTGINFEELLKTSQWLGEKSSLTIRSKVAIALSNKKGMAERL